MKRHSISTFMTTAVTVLSTQKYVPVLRQATDVLHVHKSNELN